MSQEVGEIESAMNSPGPPITVVNETRYRTDDLANLIWCVIQYSNITPAHRYVVRYRLVRYKFEGLRTYRDDCHLYLPDNPFELDRMQIVRTVCSMKQDKRVDEEHWKPLLNPLPLRLKMPDEKEENEQ